MRSGKPIEWGYRDRFMMNAISESKYAVDYDAWVEWFCRSVLEDYQTTIKRMPA